MAGAVVSLPGKEHVVPAPDLTHQKLLPYEVTDRKRPLRAHAVISPLSLPSKRMFNEAERIRIYRRQGGLCQKCLDEGKPKEESQVSWSRYQADHIMPWIKGGPILENLRATRRSRTGDLLITNGSDAPRRRARKSTKR
jgi:hypothetical protein